MKWLPCCNCQNKTCTFVIFQWTPHPRMVVLTENIVQDVDFCMNPESFSQFTIDTTFNVGTFYVTTTT